MEHKAPIGFQLRSLQNEITRYLDQRARELGLDEASLSNIWVLRILHENRGHDVFQKDLEAACGLARSTVTGIVKHMERTGLLQRESVPDDLRLKKLTLTEAGVRAHEAAVALFDHCERTLTKGFEAEELDALSAALQKLQENVRKEK